jgi:hypothetical protein
LERQKRIQAWQSRQRSWAETRFLGYNKTPQFLGGGQGETGDFSGKESRLLFFHRGKAHSGRRAESVLCPVGRYGNPFYR